MWLESENSSIIAVLTFEDTPLSEADFPYQLDWYKSSLLNCCGAAEGEATTNILSLVCSSPSPSRDFRAGITPLLRLSTLRLLLPVLTTLSVCTAPT
ncbi:hypothetical protein AYI68_g6245, partial [Smittium mucronatum]